jgi:hypothetical protein
MDFKERKKSAELLLWRESKSVGPMSEDFIAS